MELLSDITFNQAPHVLLRQGLVETPNMPLSGPENEAPALMRSSQNVVDQQAAS
jgi:hypothetical protein